MEFTVELYVYDLSQGLASSLSLQFVGKQFDGIWHTGVVCYGYEYFFGGGIQKMLPKTTPYGLPVKTHLLGKTKKSQAEFEHWLAQQRSRFSVSTYNLITNNCNNFTDACSKFLLGGVSIPDYILNLPMEFFETPVGQMMRSYFDNMMGGGHLNIDNASQQWLTSQQQQPKLHSQSLTMADAKSNISGSSTFTSSSPFHDNEKFYRFMTATNTLAILKKLKQFISPILDGDDGDKYNADVKKKLKEIVTGTLDELAFNKRTLDQEYLRDFFDKFSFLFQILSSSSPDGSTLYPLLDLLRIEMVRPFQPVSTSFDRNKNGDIVGADDAKTTDTAEQLLHQKMSSLFIQSSLFEAIRNFIINTMKKEAKKNSMAKPTQLMLLRLLSNVISVPSSTGVNNTQSPKAEDVDNDNLLILKDGVSRFILDMISCNILPHSLESEQSNTKLSHSDNSIRLAAFALSSNLSLLLLLMEKRNESSKIIDKSFGLDKVQWLAMLIEALNYFGTSGNFSTTNDEECLELLLLSIWRLTKASLTVNTNGISGITHTDELELFNQLYLNDPSSTLTDLTKTLSSKMSTNHISWKILQQLREMCQK